VFQRFWARAVDRSIQKAPGLSPRRVSGTLFDLPNENDKRKRQNAFASIDSTFRLIFKQNWFQFIQTGTKAPSLSKLPGDLMKMEVQPI
jgi:hypothetical protein